jgi:hypothetical protein
MLTYSTTYEVDYRLYNTIHLHINLLIQFSLVKRKVYFCTLIER